MQGDDSGRGNNRSFPWRKTQGYFLSDGQTGSELKKSRKKGVNQWGRELKRILRGTEDGNKSHQSTKTIGMTENLQEQRESSRSLQKTHKKHYGEEKDGEKTKRGGSSQDLAS